MTAAPAGSSPPGPTATHISQETRPPSAATQPELIICLSWPLAGDVAVIPPPDGWRLASVTRHCDQGTLLGDFPILQFCHTTFHFRCRHLSPELLSGDNFPNAWALLASSPSIPVTAA